MEIKLIDNKTFMQLAELYVKMYDSLGINAIAAMHSLTSNIATKKDFMALGAFTKDGLVAFITGYGDIDYYYSGIYSSDKTKYIKPLIDEANERTEKMGYTAWTCDTAVPAMDKILRLYGAVPISTKYRRAI